MSSTSLRERRRGLGAAADEPGDAGRVAHDVPGVVVEAHAHEQVAGEDLLLHDDLAAVLELDDVFHRDDDLEDAVLDVHRAHAAREVRLHLVLVARVGVHDVPAPGPVVRARLGSGIVLDRRAARRRRARLRASSSASSSASIASQPSTARPSTSRSSRRLDVARRPPRRLASLLGFDGGVGLGVGLARRTCGRRRLGFERLACRRRAVGRGSIVSDISRRCSRRAWSEK